MELRQLRHVLAVVDLRHFGRAAEAVGITQQALSHSILMLEKELETRLFDRGRFGAEVTQAGRIFEKRARMICGEVDFAATEVMALRGGVEGQITIGVTQNLATTMMPDAVLAFARARPKVRLSIRVGTSKQLFDMVLSGRIELAVSSPIGGIEPYNELDHRELEADYRHDPGYIIVNPRHPLLADPQILLSRLGDFPWCMPESWVAPWEEIFGLMRNAGAEAPTQVVRTDSLNFVRALLMSSNYLSLLGVDSVMSELRAGLLCAIKLPLAGKTAATFVSSRRGHQLQSATGPLLFAIQSALRAMPSLDPHLISRECVFHKSDVSVDI